MVINVLLLDAFLGHVSECGVPECRSWVVYWNRLSFGVAYDEIDQVLLNTLFRNENDHLYFLIRPYSTLLGHIPGTEFYKDVKLYKDVISKDIAIYFHLSSS